MIPCLALLATFALGLAACASPATSQPSSPEARTKAVNELRHREADLATMRAEIATVRIAAAKKEAERQELQTLVTQLRQENVASHQALVELRQAAETGQAEVATLRKEREQFLQTRNDAHQQSEKQLSELKETVLALTKEFDSIKQDLVRNAPKAAAKQAKPNSTKPAQAGVRDQNTRQPGLIPSTLFERGKPPTAEPAVRVVSEEVERAEPIRIIVQVGDTLWNLARRYGVTVEEIRQANGIERDVLMVGQELRMPLRARSSQ